MTKKLDHKKRSILDSLNGHLQLSAIRLKNIDIETNLLPENIVSFTKNHIKSSNKVVNSGLDLKRTHNIIPLVKNPVRNISNKPNKSTLRKRKPYDPLYTWNLGGRLKELRIRCQARKFFYIWRNKSIGQMTQLHIAQHYRLRLLKKTWKIWYEQYWQLRIEPRLFGRAILFHKSVKMRLIFTSWNKLTKFRLQQSRNTVIANQFNQANIMRSTFNNWTYWIFVKKCKMKLGIVAENHAWKIQLKSAFNIWKIEFRLKMEMNAQMTISMSHYNHALLKKIIRQWINVRPILRQSKLNYLKSDNHCNSILLKMTFNHWMKYHHKRKLKRKEKERWDNHYNWNLAHRYLIKWKQQYAYQLTESAVVVRCQKLSRKYQLRKYFIRWQQYIVEENVRQGHVKLADQMNDKLIKRRIWYRFKSYILIKRKKNLMKEKVQLLVDKSILQRYLYRWMLRLDEKEDANKRIEMGAARSHYRRTMYMKYFSKWLQFTSIASAYNQKLKNAIDLYHNHLIRKVINSWSKYLIISKSKTRLMNLKEHFEQKYVIYVYWIKWKNEMEIRKSLETQVNQYIAIRKNQKRNEIFQRWRLLSKMKLDEKVRVNYAQNHLNKNILSKCFTALLYNVQSKQQKRINIDLASLHWHHYLKNQVFNSWHMFCLRKKQQTDLLVWRFHKIESDIKRIVFNCWMEYLHRTRLIRHQAEEMFERKRKEIMIQTLKSWRIYNKKRKHCERQTSIKLVEAKSKLDDNLKRSIFIKWKSQAHVKLLEIENINAADDLYRAKCIRKYFHAWKYYNLIQKTHTMQEQQSFWFWKKCQLIRLWIIWKKALADRQRENYYTRFALVHWANKLQEKIFIIWFRYVNERKIKAKRENEAFEEYKNRLKRYTIRQWVMSSDFLIQWRNQHGRKSGIECPEDSIRQAVEQWKRFTEIRCNKLQFNKTNVQTYSPQVKQSSLKLFHKHVSQAPKIRARPKIPDFFLDSSQVKMNIHHKNTDIIDSGNHMSKYSGNSDLTDEVLLPPRSFENNCQEPIRSNQIPISDPSGTNKQLFEEIKHIREKLQHFKELKSILKNLELELSEYDNILTELSLNCDSSFYSEFNPTAYRTRLEQSIEDLKIDITQQKKICIDLSKRFQEIMKMLNK